MLHEFLHELTDPAHVMVEVSWLVVELTLEVIIFGWLAKVVINRRDKRHGHKD